MNDQSLKTPDREPEIQIPGLFRMMRRFPRNRISPAKLGFVAAAAMAISLLHFLTPVHNHHLHLVYDRLGYFPTILAAYWFGLWGGIVTGFLMACMHFMHIWLDWGGHFFSGNLNQTLEIMVHVLIGAVTGFLSERFILTSEMLRASYAELREKTAQVLAAETQLRRTERVQALAELSAGVAHEIRTPLAGIKGAAEILASGRLTPEQRSEFAGILSKETRHLNHVVEEFLDFARPGEHAPKPCGIVPVIQSVLDLTEQQRKSRGIEVRLDIPGDPPPVLFDPAQLKQVFVNIVTNAIQAMPGGGAIRIALRNGGGDILECVVEDTGPGFADAALDRAFDPFFTTRPNGTGLGLAIAHKIMNQHRATIEASNRSEGGARLALRFPALREAPA